MKILLVTPKPREGTSGNAVTVNRWSRLLEELGHRVVVADAYPPGEEDDGRREAGAEAGRDAPDLLVALHARRSAASVARFRSERPAAPLVVALTGTDLYRDLEVSPEARASVEAADRLVVLQEKALERLSADARGRARVIYQSARPPEEPLPGPEDEFRACMLCHMRPVKDPFLAAAAVRRLPDASRVRVAHAGRALTAGMEARARREDETNDRYRWLGELARPRALRLLAGSRLVLVTSRLEGAGNVVSEALACDVPVLATRIDGLVGMLGKTYPGYFPVGDAPALTARLHRTEVDAGYYAELRRACRERADRVRPEREREAWARLLDELGA